MITEHDVFRSESNREQEEVAAQLAVKPDRLRHNGTGRFHDHVVICRSDIWVNKQDHFDEGEYILADSTYPISKVTVPVIKGAVFSDDEKYFNSCVVHVRV
ncbi:hypothetical protein BGZ65_002511 [Modicella reniformis]|uniref:DDE Tnp4 domain-containing protein n=1 Tax=Modicella reniformis TaxID=1440133 RepID=A0A9P6J0Q2_9FUNG|nr:hypothetical protein BGZ65_002511 [Modicella reniformis]